MFWSKKHYLEFFQGSKNTLCIQYKRGSWPERLFFNYYLIIVRFKIVFYSGFLHKLFALGSCYQPTFSPVCLLYELIGYICNIYLIFKNITSPPEPTESRCLERKAGLVEELGSDPLLLPINNSTVSDPWCAICSFPPLGFLIFHGVIFYPGVLPSLNRP